MIKVKLFSVKLIDNKMCIKRGLKGLEHHYIKIREQHLSPHSTELSNQRRKQLNLAVEIVPTDPKCLLTILMLYVK